MIISLLIYFLLGLIWLVKANTIFNFNNPIQPAFIILFWPVHILLYIVVKLWF